MTKRLVIIHTVAPLIEVFNRLVKEILPGVQVFHVLDEPMLEQVRRHGELTYQKTNQDGVVQPDARQRLVEHVIAAEDIGADAVLVSCSTISPYLDELRANIPVLKIDEAMLTQAVNRGRVIGVLATNPTTIEPTRQALERKASELRKSVDIRQVLVEGAFSALLAGDGKQHDRLVSQSIDQIAAEVDLVVLAQATMARVLETRPETGWPVAILTSPHTALERVKQILEGGSQ
ncbi:MAG: Asp/Glu/hydantoin racemase [Chloroflexi bacterium]|nr:MAG: Asp/Glu/hydantoin racemase [Chloroflexota bacterium]